jgi:alkanesulfonate monooxygenase SsuD/methylene tetrahydromethanopterin reductase-like flavin-dependent oxidoreductase (luciferase family)
MSRYGVLLPTFDPLRTGETPPVTEAARCAEELGFDGLWAGDHLLCPAPVLDAVSCLTAAAVVTERIPVGFSVMLLGLRPVAWAAKQIATLQVLSHGRLKLGVGVGGEFPEEFEAAGVPVRERGRRLDAALQALPDLLGGRAPALAQTGDGPAAPPLEPAAPSPPVLVGGRSDAALRRAARFGDAWLPMWMSPEEVQRRAEPLAAFAQEYDRPSPGLALLLGVRVGDDLAATRAHAAAQLHGQYRLALERVERWTALGSEAAVAEFLAPYREVGVQEFVFMPLGPEPLEQYERLAEVRARLES